MPLKFLLIGGSPCRWKWNDPDRPFKNSNGIESFVDLFEGEYRHEPPSPAEMGEFDLVFGNLNPDRIEILLKAAASRPAHVRWVSLVEGDAETYLDDPPIELFDTSDLVATINTRTTAYFQSLTQSPVRWIGVPYPVDRIAQHTVALDQRSDRVLLCPRSARMPSIAVAKKLNLPILAFTTKLSRKLKNVPELVRNRTYDTDFYRRKLLDQLAPLEATVGLELEKHEFFGVAAGCSLWLNLDPRYTWARYVLDAAALRVPIVTTASTDHGPYLFPETTVQDVFEVEQAAAIAARLLEDQPYATEIANQAFARLDRYRPEACAERLRQALSLA